MYFILFLLLARLTAFDGVGIDPHGGGGRVGTLSGVRIDPEGVTAQSDEGPGMCPHGGRG